jgi:hypothetical protein
MGSGRGRHARASEVPTRRVAWRCAARRRHPVSRRTDPYRSRGQSRQARSHLLSTIPDPALLVDEARLDGRGPLHLARCGSHGHPTETHRPKEISDRAGYSTRHRVQASLAAATWRRAASCPSRAGSIVLRRHRRVPVNAHRCRCARCGAEGHNERSCADTVLVCPWCHYEIGDYEARCTCVLFRDVLHALRGFRRSNR